MEGFGAGHLIYIPAVLFIGVIIGWILGSRAAKDAYAVELRRREQRSASSARLEARAKGLRRVDRQERPAEIAESRRAGGAGK
jgi:hypothetical protein